MSDDQVRIRLAALEQENAQLRARLGGEAPAAPEAPPAAAEAAPKPSKLEVELARLMQMAKDLAAPNDPRVDQTVQNTQRTQALCSVVVKLSSLVLNGFGATGAVVRKVNLDVADLRREVDEVKVFVGGAPAPAVSSEGESGGTIEVDDTKPPEVPAAPAKANGGGQKRRPTQVAAVPPAASTAPAPAPPAGMPAEVAGLPQAVPAAIASVKVSS